MERLTERDSYWLGEEFWTSAKEPDDKEIDNVYAKLKEYEDLEEQGLLIRLPCKVGTKELYIIDEYEEIYYLDADEVTIKRFPTGTIIFEYDSYELEYKDFGKTVFLTKEEAERALEERK